MYSRPNILVVMTDQQRGDTALPGHPLNLPHLNRFAEQGLRFTSAWCPSPHCCPSRNTFFTGLYPSEHGVWNNVLVEQALQRTLRPGVRMWSEDLAEAGYDLHFAGKWHVSAMEHPKDRGWQELADVSETSQAESSTRWSLYTDLAANGHDTRRSPGQILRPGWPPIQVYGTMADDAIDRDDLRVKAAIDCLSDKRNSPTPWGLYVGLSAPHDPYFARREFLDRVPENPPLPPSFGDSLEGRPGIYRRLREQIFGQLPEQEWRQVIRHYWACCLQIDDAFGRILAALEATGQADNTLVVFCSDHGDYLGDHGLLCKGIPCFTGAYHIPAVVRWPKGIRQPGRTVSELVSLADFAPTFLEVAGVKSPGPTTGRSLMPFLRAEPAPVDWRDAVFTQCNGVELYYTQRSVRTKDWVYVYNGFDLDELYDLNRDPHQTHNLASDPTFTPIVQALCGRMWRFARETHDTIINPYWTVGLAPFGPATAFSDQPTRSPAPA